MASPPIPSPVICFDESPTQLIGEVRAPIAEPGRLERFDFEYKRNGTVNGLHLSTSIAPGARSRSPSDVPPPTSPNACASSATHFPEAEKIRVVMDNLSTHSPASLYNALPAPEARRISAAWSSTSPPSTPAGNMVEIEIGVLRGQCLDRRISSRDML